MTNALITLNRQPVQLSDTQAAVMAEMQREDERRAFQYIPPRIKLPSGGLDVFITGDGDTLKPGFDAIIAVSQMARAYWPIKSANGLPPLCSSADSAVGWLAMSPDKEQVRAALSATGRHPGLMNLDADHTGPYACDRCPLSGWATAPDGGRGQACKALRRLVLLIDGWTTPAILTLPPTSCKAWDLYASSRARTPGQSYFTVRTRFDLERKSNAAGTQYSVVKLSVSAPLTEAETAAVLGIRAQYADLVRSMEIEPAEYEFEA
ncbi:MAG: hypothetical protein ACOYNY_20340 [Caldilineaceae bacterium]